MKTTMKITIIIAVIFIALGIGIISVGVVMSDGNIESLFVQDQYVDKEYSVQTNGITKITLENSNSKIRLIQSDSDKICLSYAETEKVHYDIDVNDSGELIIQFQSSMKWYDYIGFHITGDRSFEVAVPNDLVCDISLNTTNGKITADGLLIKGNLSFKSSNGDINLSDLNFRSASVRTSNGSLNLTNLSCEEDIKAETSNGRVEIENIWVGNRLNLKSSNGTISGTINGKMEDFNISSHTSNGNNNLPNNYSGGVKNLYVQTSNGTINITFLP